jgi:hypothetical protein
MATSLVLELVSTDLAGEHASFDSKPLHEISSFQLKSLRHCAMTELVRSNATASSQGAATSAGFANLMRASGEQSGRKIVPARLCRRRLERQREGARRR